MTTESLLLPPFAVSIMKSLLNKSKIQISSLMELEIWISKSLKTTTRKFQLKFSALSYSTVLTLLKT